jgi:glucose-1-phosphate thymidylyltransferase
MQILLPIAGLGTRVRPHTHVRPKPMLPLAGKPVLGHLLDSLLPLKPSSVIFIVGERGHMVESYVRGHYELPVHFRTQHELKGQSHAVKMAADLITEPVLIIFGDTVFEAPLDQITDSSVDGAIVVHQVDDPRRFGVVELRDGLIVRMHEKPEQPPSSLAMIGVYMLNDYRGLLQAIDAQIADADALQGEFFLANAVQRMIDAGDRLKPVQATGWYDTGTIEAVLDTHRYLVEKNRLHPPLSPNATVIEPCHIDPTATLERCVVGPYVSIGPRAVIRDSVIGDAIIGEESVVSGLYIQRSIIGSHAELSSPPLSYNVADHSAIAVATPVGNAR